MDVPLINEKASPMFVQQAVILCGGLGTRLGRLAADTPKPLLPVGDVPFLEILIREISRSGIRRFLLLAGHMSDQVEAFAAALADRLGSGFTIEVFVESERAGTGGALFEAREQIEDVFALFNGDSFLDFHLHALAEALEADPALLGAIALRHVPDVARFGHVVLDGPRIAQFNEKSAAGGDGLINGGAYLFRREILDRVPRGSSLEQNVLQAVANDGLLAGRVFDGFFIDIGLPETYAEAEVTLQSHRRRPAAFLDRDGVLNRDLGHVGTLDRFQWNDGAIEAIKRLNASGMYVFVVTNQAGIAKGKYGIDDYWRLRDQIRAQLMETGAQIDDERFCPYHADGMVSEWRHVSSWRKPEPGMLLDLLDHWPIDCEGSFLIGDQPTDIAAAAAAGIKGYLFSGGDLDQFVAHVLNS